MKLTKMVIALTTAFAAMVGHADSGDSSPFLLDTAEGTRIATEGKAIPIAYSPHWNGAASCSVTETGRAALIADATDEGAVSWTPSGTGAHTLTHTAGDLAYTAQFSVLGDDVVLHGGILAAGETWGTNKVHLVTAAVTVPSGVSLTIQAGAVVKFMPGTSLTIASGGSCTARGVIFTHVNDDTIGGDTLMDGDGGSPGTARPTMGDYAITGNITDDDSTEYRYMPPQTLQSSISSNTRLRGYRTYIVSNSVTVASGATLTLQPGTILKFNTGCSLTVNGTLDAQGTRAAPIVFTSLKDDAHGGDANGDGEKTLPDANDWRSIYVSGKASFSFTEILYGGGTSSSSDSGVLVGNSSGTISLANTTIAHAMYDGIFSRATVTGENVIIHDCDRGINTCGGSGVFKNCVIDRCRWGVMAEGGSGTYYNCIITRFYGSTSWPTGWGVAYWSGSLKTYNCCVYSTLSGASNYRSSPTTVNNIVADPLFEDADNMNFRIAANSPCVDAGDGTVAPETDYWGQPRMDVKRVKDTGTPNGDGVCPDIGIYEVPGAAAVPLPDLAVVSISRTGSLPVQGGNALAARCTAGDAITITYVVTNRGAAAVTGLVRDLFRFKGADAALGGLTVDAAEVEQAYNVAAGGSAEFTATLTIPTLKAGAWKVEVGVNVGNYPYEQNLSNNRATIEDAISVELEAMGMGTQSVTVGKGESAGFVLSGLPTAGGVVRVTGGGDAIAAYGGNGAVPTSRTGCQPVQSGNGQAARCTTGDPAVLPLADGSLLVVFPARAEGENAYLVLENGGNAAATVSVEVKETELKIYGAEPGRVANVGEATVTITGSGMVRGSGTLAASGDNGGRGATALPVVTLGGREAKSVEVLNAAQIAATFDVDGMSAGAVALVATVSGGAPSSATAPDAIEIYAAKTGPKLRAWLEMPSSVRDGRVFTGYVCYANEGDSPMAMPVFKIAREDSQTKMGLVASESMTETKLYVGGISPTHPAGVLKAGDAARIPFYFQPFGTYRIKLTHIKDAEDLEAYPTFGGTKAYLAAMSAAATRLNLRGRTAYNVHDFVDQALWEKNGVAHAAVSGYLVDAKTGEPLANTDVSLVAADSEAQLAPATGTTDESGYFQLTNLADGEYRWLLDSGNTLADASTNTVTIAEQADINGISVYATPGGRISGYVFAASGEPISDAGITIALTNGMEKAKARTDASGAFRVSGLENGVYCIVAHSFEGFVGDGVSGIVISETERSCERTLTLVPGGVIMGSVTSGGSLVSQGQVQAILPDGTTIETTCSTNGTYVFNGLKPESYVIRYYSSTEESSDAKVTINQGEVCILDMTALPRPLFFPRYSVGYGSLTTEFIFGDYVRMTNITAWAWDFDDDGIVDSTEAQPTHTFDAIRPYTVSVSFTEGGTNVTSRFENCVEVREPLETIYADNVVVVGGKNGEELSVIEVGDGHIAISGSPALPFAEGVVVFYGDVENGFARKIRSASGNASRWDIETDEAELTDVFRQLATCTAMTLGADGTVQNAHGRRFLASKADRTTDWKVFVEGGVTVTPIIRNTRRDIEFVCEIRDGEFKRLHAGVIDSADIGLSYSINGEVGVEFQEELPWCEEFNLKGIKHVGYGFLLYPDVHIGINVRISGRADSIEMTHVRNCRLRLGFDMVDGNWKWWKPFETSPLDTEFGGDTHPGLKGEAKIFVSPGYKFSWMKTALSIRVGAEAYLKATLDGGSNEKPFKAALAAGVDVQCEANLIDVDWPFLKKFGLKLKLIEPINYTVWGGEFVSITGPIPEFDWQPIVPDAPAHITFYDQSTPTILNWFGKKLEYPVTDLEWNVGGAESKTLQPRFLFEKEGTYPVQLRAKTRGMMSGHNFKRHYVTVGKPEEIPDDPYGDEETDDTEEDKGKQSWDPNEMVGEEGVGEARYVKPGQELTYTIYFENKEGFDIADAQEVKVTNPLSEWLDWSTFEMREVAFNNQNDNSLDGLSGGTRDIKMNGTNKYVRVALGGGSDGAGSIAETGVAHWYLRVYDPNGNFGWPNDGSGFLPSNDSTHRGEGHITYRVKVREDAPANVKIVNSASIVFDYNPPIETEPNWTNTVAQVASVKINGDVEGDVTDLDLIVGLPYGELPTPKARAGYTFGGWYTGPNGTGRRVRAQDLVQSGDSGLYAYWLTNAYIVRFNANGGTGQMSDQAFEFDKPAALDANAFTRQGFVFAGWATSATGEAVFTDGAEVRNLTDVDGGVVTLYATWMLVSQPEPTPGPTVGPTVDPAPAPMVAETPRLWTEVTGAAPAVAALYEGCFCDGAGNVKGTIQVKVGKPGKKDGRAAVSAVVVGLGGKKTKLKAAENGKAKIEGDGPTTVSLSGGDACVVTLGAKGMSGTYGSYAIDGSLNVFASKDAANKTLAAGVLGKWQGAVNVAWQNAGAARSVIAPYQTLSVTIAAKGKAKVSGTLADGTKVSAKGQLVVGDNWCCVPVVCAKKGVSLLFAVWLPKAATSAALPVVVGLGGDVKVGKPGALKGGAAFRIDAAALEAVLGKAVLPYLPDGLAVTGGTKWTLPKAGSVTYEKGTTTVDAAKAGENPSALKLTYKAKDGTFKGSFKAYADVGGKPKSTTVNVTGVLVDGVGYGAATVKKVGGVAVTVE